MRQSMYALACRALQGDASALTALENRMEKGAVIACDFDGTLCRSAWPGIGEEISRTIKAAKLCRALGAKIILWTCREYEALDAAVAWCGERGLHFDAVNDNVQEILDLYGVNSRKISVDEYWDDKAVVPEEEEI